MVLRSLLCARLYSRHRHSADQQRGLQPGTREMSSEVVTGRSPEGCDGGIPWLMEAQSGM